MLGLSIWKIAIIGGIIVLLFGKGKISGMMGDLAQGIKSFKKGMTEDESGRRRSTSSRPRRSRRPPKEKASA